jgi:hypothetical protein
MAPFTGRPAEGSFTIQRRHHETVVLARSTQPNLLLNDDRARKSIG